MEFYQEIKARINRSNVMDMVPQLRGLTLGERELLARQTGTRVVYLGEEVDKVRKAEEEAALRARPVGFEPAALNGINVGCGNRLITPHLTPVDIARDAVDGGHAMASQNAWLASPDNLPFRAGTVDYIVALHVLEHIHDPVATIRYWLDLLRPGGGIGLVLPDWRYQWDARNDVSLYGHKWNSCPDVMLGAYHRHLAGICILEALATIPYKGSFDVVLRKPGHFQPFSLDHVPPPARRDHDPTGMAIL
ncbi:putative SAM-dependent methyltransferase [Novosphingobium sp. SG751A]|uniref:methyltransferase domain-containing protein n=1 Tax=Novosphingobium sp. SG751A TaxID=2587000 RepID=UPI0015518AAF|nr:methyltransferase domain-containing protein [Novosphingobium sp. SG751A]NOW44555.1 putative SAM-dependent methyltransferase [Novosphingobium sp. SG751A]